MLVKCIECNHEVSEYAEMCPHCGCPIDKIKEGLQTDTVVVEVVEKTVASNSFDVMKTICPVCKNECESGAEICPICGFDELHKEFISKEDGNLWLETVVIPYRTEWENSQVDLSDFEIEGTVLKKYKGNAEKVVIPRRVTRIDIYAFSYCKNLTEITIPSSVTIIGDNAFVWCKNLTEIIVNKDNKKFITENGILFSKEKTKLLRFPEGKVETKYKIPNSVTYIGDCAFSGCENLTEITIPNRVTSIGNNAFFWCENLTEIIVNGDNEKYISENGILFNKDKTELIHFPEGNMDTKYKIPSSVTSIGDHAFFGCKNLTEITIPGRVISIGEDAFGRCKNLTEITIPDSVTSIGKEAFGWCENVAEITIPSSVTSIGPNAFSFCSNLQKVYIPQKLKIGDEVFYCCHPDLEIIRY